MAPDEILDFAREVLDAYGLDGWVATDDTRAVTRAGQCRWRSKEIGLTCSLLSRWPEDEVLDTILHETAHALVGPGKGHGPEWKAMARKVGARPSASYDGGDDRLAGPEPKWHGVCSRGHTYSKTRQPTSVRLCRKCPENLEEFALVIDWKHVSGKSPDGKGYRGSYRRHLTKFRAAYASGLIEPGFGAPEGG